MKVHTDIERLPVFKDAVITIGSYDGVHRGHKKILKRIRNLSKETGGESILITFHPHPRSIVYPKDGSIRLLSSLEEKIRLVEQQGVDHLVVVPFTIEFSQQDPYEYLEKFLVNIFNPRFIIVGYDHRFGLNRGGNTQLLINHEEKYNYKVVEIPKEEIEEVTISSSQVRKAVAGGDVSTARSLLGHSYHFRGTVIHGDKIGQQLGYPTANLSLPSLEKLMPVQGIYAVTILCKHVLRKGMLYIGNRPTLNSNQQQSYEVNIFDFNEDIYDLEIEVFFEEYIREDIKFNNLDELREQLKIDEKNAREALEFNASVEKQHNTTIAILNYNGVEHLETFLPSVTQAVTSHCKVCVIDNASTDDSVSFISEWYPEIEIIQLHKNYGFADGYNKGLKDIETEYTFILNSDVKLESSSISTLIDILDNNPDICAVQPTIMSLEDPGRYEYAGGAGGWIDTLGYPFCRGRILDSIETENSAYKSKEIFWASGAAMLVRTDVFKSLGGFDGSYFAHQEEIDLCWRIKRAGYKIMHTDGAKVYHLGGGTLNYGSPRKTYLNFRNNIKNLLKNEDGVKLIWLLPFRFLLDSAAALMFLFTGKKEHFLSVTKAYFHNVGSILDTLESRKSYRKKIFALSIDKPNKNGIFKGSILYEYYIKKTRTTEKLTEA